MTQRFAATAALIVFLTCLAVGLHVGNSFGTVVGRALLAMVVTLVIGLVVGSMMNRSLDENFSPSGEKIQKTGTDSGAGDR